MAEECKALRKVREYRRQRDSAVEGEDGDVMEDGRLLREAAEGGELDVVKYLVEEVDVSVEVDDGGGRMRPLHLAAAKGHLPVVEYLVARGRAEIEAEDWYQSRPLHCAAAGGHLGVVRYLVEHGAFVEAKDYGTSRPLHLAVQHHQPAVAEYLILEGGADVEAEMKEGDTLLHRSAFTRDLSLMELLLERGASADVEDGEGCRPLHYAAGRLHLPVVQCLLQHRAGSIDVNAQNRTGNTALHLAAGAGEVEEEVLGVVRLLVEEADADPLLRNRGGQRASDRARDMGISRVEKYLLEAEEMAEMQKQA